MICRNRLSGYLVMFFIIFIVGIFKPSHIHSQYSSGVPIFRISVENTLNHVQALAVEKFASDISRKTQGSLDVQFFHTARMFRDKDIIAALGQGRVEMAVPGTWQIDRFEPSVGIFLLPSFYGRSGKYNHTLMDGPVGIKINENIENRLGLKVLGRWIDLGHAHLYGINRHIKSDSDISGLKVRVAGGVANAMRIKAMGGIPMIIAWPDLKTRMDQGMVDVVLTTHETVVSDRLWEHGIVSVFEDREYFPQYVPLVSGSFWKRLSPDMRQVLSDTWESIVDGAREDAAHAQEKARDILIAKGVNIVTPSPESMESCRNKIMADEPTIVEKMGIDKHLHKTMLRELLILESN
ncbi:MAG: TRAP transporter substrate-binding protein DctP [Desulfamplus sp.]|nr:TRAP transporter substrate-binding protein DctP [Desulfamplus sp.]